MVDPRKYARVERERRFLVPVLPGETPWAVRSIKDLYVAGTRLRLRHSEGIVDGQPELLCKLTQKVPDPEPADGVQGTITTMYLDEDEYERFAVLPGRRLTKTRFSFPPMGCDVFEGSIAGLMIAEVEFPDDESMASFASPPWCGREITHDERYQGGRLAEALEASARPPLT